MNNYHKYLVYYIFYSQQIIVFVKHSRYNPLYEVDVQLFNFASWYSLMQPLAEGAKSPQTVLSLCRSMILSIGINVMLVDSSASACVPLEYLCLISSLVKLHLK